MEIFYGDNKFKKQLSSTTEIKKALGNNAKTVSLRLEQIKAAPTLATLVSVLQNKKCHPLTGDMAGEWAISISGNYRIIFEITHDPVPENEDGSVDTKKVTQITLLRVQDYH